MQQGSALALHDADREYLATLHTKLHDPSLLQTVPIIPPPPVFFKHTELSTGCDSPWDAGGRSPPGAYKLLSSDYDWLADPQKALAAKQKQQLEPPLPEPPMQMQQSRFLSRARTLLVKLRQQINEIVHGALQQGTQQLMLCLEEELDGGGGIGAAATSLPTNYTDPSRSARVTSSIGLGMMMGSASFRPAQGAGVNWAGKRGQGAEALGGAFGGIAADHPIVANMGELGQLAQTQLGAMFEDCLSDLMEELWTALQYGGSANGKVDALANRMAQREKDIEELAQRKLTKVEGELGKVQQELHKTQEALREEREEKLNLVSAFQAKEAQLKATLQSFQDRGLMNEKLQQDIDELEKELEHLKISRGEQIQAACKELAERNEGLTCIIAGNKAMMHAKDHEMGLLHVRLAEQLTMLDLAFSRRDVEVKRTADLEAVLAETMDLLVSEGQNSLDQWATLNAENCVPGALSVMELREGEWGMGKALMEAARRRGAALTITELRKAMPAELPKYEPKVAEDDEDAPPRIEMEEECIDESVPQLWMRLIHAPLQEHLPLPVLLRRIRELYAEKERDDEWADATGIPRQTLHATVYRSFMKRFHTAVEAEQQVAVLLQSLKANAGRSHRCALMLRCLGLRKPTLPDTGFAVMRAMDTSIRGPPPPGQPAVVNEDMGAVSWVSPARWRPILSSVLSLATSPDTAKAAIRAAYNLRPDPSARSKPHAGMVDLDGVLHVAMDAWAQFYHEEAFHHLEQLFLETDIDSKGILSPQQFQDLAAKATNTKLNAEQVLRLQHECLAESCAAGELAKAKKQKGVARGAMDAPSFAKVVLRKGLLGSLPRTVGSTSIVRLAAALDLMTDLSNIAINDIKREGLPRTVFEQLESMQRLLHKSRAELGDGGSIGAVSEDKLADGWTLVAAVGRKLKEVSEECVVQRTQARKQEERAAAAAAAKAAAEQAALEEDLSRALKDLAAARAAAKVAQEKAHQVAAAHHQAAEDAKHEGAEMQARQQKVIKEPQSPRKETAKANLDLKQAPRYLQSLESKARGGGSGRKANHKPDEGKDHNHGSMRDKLGSPSRSSRPNSPSPTPSSPSAEDPVAREHAKKRWAAARTALVECNSEDADTYLQGNSAPARGDQDKGQAGNEEARLVEGLTRSLRSMKRKLLGAQADSSRQDELVEQLKAELKAAHLQEEQRAAAELEAQAEGEAATQASQASMLRLLEIAGQLHGVSNYLQLQLDTQDAMPDGAAPQDGGIPPQIPDAAPGVQTDSSSALLNTDSTSAPQNALPPAAASAEHTQVSEKGVFAGGVASDGDNTGAATATACTAAAAAATAEDTGAAGPVASSAEIMTASSDNGRGTGGVEAMVGLGKSEHLEGGQSGSSLGAQARLGSSQTIKPEWRMDEGSTLPAEEESGIGGHRCQRPTSAPSRELAPPQWVLDQQAAQAARAQDKAATAAATAAARRPASGGSLAGRVLAASGGPFLATLDPTASTLGSGGGGGLHGAATFGGGAAGAMHGQPTQGSMSDFRPGPIDRQQGLVQAFVDQAREPTQHPNTQRWHSGAAAGALFAQTLQARAKPFQTIRPSKSARGAPNAPAGNGHAQEELQGGREGNGQQQHPQQQQQQQPQSHTHRKDARLTAGAAARQGAASAGEHTFSKAARLASGAVTDACLDGPSQQHPHQLDQQLQQLDQDPQQLHLVLALMQSSSRLTLEAAHLLAQSQAEAQAQAERRQSRSLSASPSRSLSTSSPSRSLATSPTRRPTSRLAQQSPSQARASPSAHPLSRPLSAQQPGRDSRADAFHARLVASHGALRVPSAAGEGLVGQGHKGQGERTVCSPPAAPGVAQNGALDGGRQHGLQAQDQMVYDSRHRGSHPAAGSDAGGSDDVQLGHEGSSSSISGAGAANAAGTGFHYHPPLVPTITMAQDAEDADPALFQMDSPTLKHTTTTATATTTRHQQPSPLMAAQPLLRPQSASSAWTDRHRAWHDQPMAQVLAAPAPLISQRPLDPFTHSATFLANSRAPPTQRPQSATTPAPHSGLQQAQQPQLPLRPGSASASTPATHSQAQPPTKGTPGYPLPYLHARTPSPELPPRMVVQGRAPAAQTVHPTLTSSPSQSSTDLSGTEGPQQIVEGSVLVEDKVQEEGCKDAEHQQDVKELPYMELDPRQEGQQQRQYSHAGMATAKNEAPQLPVIDLQALDPGVLLSRSFRLAPEEIEELGVGLLALVRHAGGFPHVAHNGALISASGTTVVAPPAGTGGMPDFVTQRDLLSKLYIHTAGIVAAQHRRAAALKAYESDLDMRLKGLQQAANRVMGLHKSSSRAGKRMQQRVQQIAGVEEQLEMLGFVLSSVWRHTAGCSDVAHAIQNEDVQQQQLLQQARMQEQAAAAAAVATASPQPLQQHTAFLLHALESLAQDVGHARTIVDQARAVLQGLGVHPPPPSQHTQTTPGAQDGSATHPGWTQQSVPHQHAPQSKPYQHTPLASALGERAATLGAPKPSGFDQGRLGSLHGSHGRMSSPSGNDNRDALSGLASIQRLMQQLGGATEGLPHQTNISDASTALLLAELLDPVELFQRLHRSPSSRLSSPPLTRPSSASPLPQRAQRALSPGPRPSSASPVYNPPPSWQAVRTASSTTLPPLSQLAHSLF